MEKKRTHIRLRIAMFVVAAVLLAAPCFAKDTTSAVPCKSSIYLNDVSVDIDGYTIYGNNYFKLRDLAYVLRDTTSCFDVIWNAAAERVEITTQLPYSETKPSSQNSWSYNPVQATPGSAALTINGQSVNIKSYVIGGNNYYKLRDLSEALSFAVYWVEEDESICVYTMDEHNCIAEGTHGTTRKMSESDSTARWSHLVRSYLYNDGDNFYVVDGKPSNLENTVSVDTYDAKTFELLESKSVPVELNTFGGFYAGEIYNYMVFGQNNKEENNQKEVIRVVKYSKDFQRLDSVSITGGESFTTEPFHSGSLRMAENGNELAVHTARLRYTTSDGLNHQSQLTIRVDTNTMKVKNSLGEYQENHVSHSFNQFVLFDENTLALLDHGDAYPRSVVLHRPGGSSVVVVTPGDGSPSYSFTYQTEGGYTETEMLEIPGETGANCTGVTVGGFEASSSSYIAAINTIDHSKVSSYDSYGMAGLDQDERDVVLLVCPKNGTNTRQVRLTDYIDKGKLGSTPYLVKLSSDRFLVLWEEFAYQNSSYYMSDLGVRYVEVNGSGEPLMDIQSLQNAHLSNDCQPILVDGMITWYINVAVGRMFYRVGIAA